MVYCLEFSRSMRIIDPYDEINYLGLECAIQGAPWIRAVLLDMLRVNLGGGRTGLSWYSAAASGRY